MVIYCKRCLYSSDHPLGIVFDENGICSGCKVHEEKDTLDWNERWRELEALIKPYKTKEAKYDCIVPVSGAKDSFFILDIVVNKLKLKPLVVNYNKFFNTPTGIKNLARLRIAFDVDFQMKNVDPRVAKKLTKISLHSHGNPYWHCLAGETVYPVQTAVHMKIPLIIWGAHQGLEQVGMYSHTHNVEMSRRYRKDHDLFGVGPENIKSPFDQLSEEDTINYRYPPFSDIEQIGVRGIYLGNYVRWDPYAQHLNMVKEFGFYGNNLARTFDCYDHADCYVYSNLHDILKYYKHGFSKVTDQVCREIRFGRLTRKAGKQVVKFYENREPAYMELFCNWLGIEQGSLKFAINRHRNRKFWKEVSPDNWKRTPLQVFDSMENELEHFIYPNCGSTTSPTKNEKFITIGKGVDWPRPRDTGTFVKNWL